MDKLDTPISKFGSGSSINSIAEFLEVTQKHGFTGYSYISHPSILGRTYPCMPRCIGNSQAAVSKISRSFTHSQITPPVIERILVHVVNYARRFTKYPTMKRDKSWSKPSTHIRSYTSLNVHHPRPTQLFDALKIFIIHLGSKMSVLFTINRDGFHDNIIPLLDSYVQ